MLWLMCIAQPKKPHTQNPNPTRQGNINPVSLSRSLGGGGHSFIWNNNHKQQQTTNNYKQQQTTTNNNNKQQQTTTTNATRNKPTKTH